MLRVVLEGRPILLARVEGRVLACDDGCTHDRASLAAGWLEGHRVECPRHGALFDLRDGRAVALPATVGVGTYRVHEQDGEIRVQLHGTGQVNESESER